MPMELGHIRKCVRNELAEDLARIDEQVRDLFLTLSTADLTTFDIFEKK